MDLLELCDPNKAHPNVKETAAGAVFPIMPPGLEFLRGNAYYPGNKIARPT
jgi:hypothetical protein